MISYLEIVITCLDAPEQHFLALLAAQKAYPALTAGSLPSLCCGSWTFPVPFLPVSHIVCVCCATQHCHTGVHPQRVMHVLHVRSHCLCVPTLLLFLDMPCLKSPCSWLRAELSASCIPALFLGYGVFASCCSVSDSLLPVSLCSCSGRTSRPC